MKNATLMVSAIGNEIYLGTMKKNSKYPVMNERRVKFTDIAIRAVTQHMMAMTEGDSYEFPGHGKLVWVPEKKEDTTCTDSTSTEQES